MHPTNTSELWEVWAERRDGTRLCVKNTPHFRIAMRTFDNYMDDDFADVYLINTVRRLYSSADIRAERERAAGEDGGA